MNYGHYVLKGSVFRLRSRLNFHNPGVQFTLAALARVAKEVPQIK